MIEKTKLDTRNWLVRAKNMSIKLLTDFEYQGL